MGRSICVVCKDEKDDSEFTDTFGELQPDCNQCRESWYQTVKNRYMARLAGEVFLW
jgi:hypothetical protein